MSEILTQPVRKERAFTGRHMLLTMLGFFGVVLAANVIMATFSATTWTGLVVENSYIASQEFQTRLDALRVQQSLGWESRFDYSDGMATLTVTDAAGDPVDLGTVRLQLNRPIGQHDDAVMELARADNGTYGAAVTLAPGVWEVMVDAEQTSAGPYELHERFVLRAPPTP